MKCIWAVSFNKCPVFLFKGCDDVPVVLIKSQSIQIFWILLCQTSALTGPQKAVNDFGDQSDLSKIQHCKENQSDFLILQSVKNGN